MNTMVGMQASLHTPTEDSLSELMKNANMEGPGPVMQGGLPSQAVAAAPLDVESEDGDEFDADELLKSPLLNDSAEKLVSEDVSFGDFGASGGGGNGNSSANPNTTSSAKRESVPMGLRRSDDSSFAAIKQHQLQQGQMSQPTTSYDGHERDMPYEEISGSGANSSFSSLMQDQQQNFQNSGIDSKPASQNSFPAQVGSLCQFNGYRGGGQMMDDSSHAEFDHDDGNVSIVNPYLAQASNNNCHSRHYRSAPERSSSSASSSYESDGSQATPRAANAAMLDLSQGSHMSSNGAEGSTNAPMFRRAVPQRSKTYHSGTSRSPLEMMKEQQELRAGGDNQLEMMQQHLQQMQEMDQFEMQLQQHQQHQQHQHQQQQMENNSGVAGMAGLARSMNTPARSASCGPMGGYNNDGTRGPASFPVGTFNNIGGGAARGRFPSDLEPMQNELGMQTMSGGGNSGNNPKGPVTVNDAMEKLCESMKRSAMSRTLVKQFSAGARGVPRTNSAGLAMARQVSNRDVWRSSSNRNLAIDDSSHRSTDSRPAVPVRRISNKKHQLQGRGVYRHGSGHLVGVNGTGNSNLSLQIDGRNMGSL